MADNINVTTVDGTTTVAADDISGVKVQRVKVQTGADNSATDVSSSNPMPVTASGTVAATQSGTWNSRLQDGSGTALTSSVRGAASDKQALDVAFTSSIQDMTVTAGSGTRYFPSSAGVDTLNYGTYTLFCTSAGSAAGGMSLEFSDDGTLWVTLPFEFISSGSVTLNSSSTLSLLVSAGARFAAPCYFRYMRITTTGTVTGSYVMKVALTPASLPKNVINVQGASNDADIFIPANMVNVAGAQFAYAGFGLGWSRVRVPNIFKTITATASGDTAVWTPTSSRKFRVMRYQIEVTSDAATSGGADIDIVLRDATTAIGAGVSVYVPAVAGTAFGNGYSSSWRDLGNGYVSTTANNVLNVNLSAALSSGKVRVNVAGVEE